MTAPRLRLISVGPPDEDAPLREWLARELRAALGREVLGGTHLALDPTWHDAEKDTYRSDLIVDALIRRDAPVGALPPRDWVLAIARADLAPTGRDFVFGEATLGGAWAVVSLARLRSPEPALTRLRLLKEALHELGHIAGLEHCVRRDCVMRPSRSVADTDRKPADFCPGCRARLDAHQDP